MHRRDFHYDLPPERIAQRPLSERAASRLLCVDGARGTWEDRQFRNLPDLLRAGDLLVFNDTRVMPARLLGRKATGGRVEVLVERILAPNRVLAHVRASHAPKAGVELRLEEALTVTVTGRVDDLFELRFEGERPVREWLSQVGRVPLPPYIERDAASEDLDRYQTVYAARDGAVAAPTAGLHFDQPMLDALTAAGIETGAVTLHVGAGTFRPVRSERIEEHRMHSEWLQVSPELCERVRATRQRGGRVVAVGTTVVRALESASASGTLQAFEGDTDCFIYPGYRFRSVDRLITNFHLPESTLLMLVSAFGGYDTIMAAYRHAVAAEYRFFSYGDAMWIAPAPDALAPAGEA